MSDPADPKQLGLGAELHRYLVDHGTPPDDLLSDLIAETRERFGDRAGMQIDPAQGPFLTMLARLLDARVVVEVGTFTGYSSICLARGIVPGGHLLCLDVSETFTAVARSYWQRAGLDDRIELRIGPAIDTLSTLPDDPPVDLAFIDADKGGYLDYYEALVPRMRPGGVIAIDNVLWSGAVVDPSRDDADTEAIRRFNDLVASDQRVDVVMLPLSDGVTLARVR
ncbi:MAG: O-methyltransferase [Acidimicrobiales bacterium]